MAGQMDEWMDGHVGRWIDREWINGWMRGWTGR